MKIKILSDDREIIEKDIVCQEYENADVENKVSYIAFDTKQKNFFDILSSYCSNSKSILYDNSNKTIQEKMDFLQIDSFHSDIKNTNTIFEDKDFSFIYFTSGTTGSPVGALKTKENIIREMEVQSKLFKKYNLKRVIVTVPFIHFYGSLFGLFFALQNGIDVVFKEHFLPHDLLEVIDDYSLVVTTPLYIKSLNMLGESKDLSKSIFLSSTAPLFPDVAQEFNTKFNTDIMQLFGSTETGGIAYKYNDEVLWTPLEDVNLSCNENGELHVSSPFVSKVLYEDGFKETNGEIQTFDYVEFHGNKFQLVGRSSQIIKLAGKRYSTVQIEQILEKQANINKAVVYVETNQKSLRGEVLNITLETNSVFSSKEIKQIIKNELSNLKFSIKLQCVDTIKTTAIGKKIIF